MIQQRLRTKIFIIVPILLFFSAYGIFSYNLDQMPLGGDEQVYYYPAFVNYFGFTKNQNLTRKDVTDCLIFSICFSFNPLLQPIKNEFFIISSATKYSFPIFL